MPRYLDKPTRDGIVAIGGPINTETLLQAYTLGVFPWPHDGYPLLWFSLDPRAILVFDALHVGDRLARKRRNSHFTFSINACFETVIARCALTKRQGQLGTWITEELFEAFIQFHQAGYAHSVEVWENGDVVAGLYGVYVNGVFSGESMFTTVNDGSKMAVLYLIDHLKSLGHTWIDIQQMTPHFSALGAITVPRSAFKQRLQAEASVEKPPFISV